ncbi:aldo/keto reductase [Dyadobacter psychrotolerans]|uniref:Aldo/keto reductase n=1 Tax=Dyadobacter psychrotolerans TaxID=2541721 RepID=A0A4V2Z4R3_9BACT|nr:aldo/keto reductase [Dyadobacter psychrotolerans]TDE17658.1 aldo/keto reductase [Dyadobacter psychrotolerans]
MEKRQLGESDLYVAPLTLGGNVFGWTIDEKKSFEILDEFVASGFNLIDTADVYSRWVPGNNGGESEKIIGKWMKERANRNKVIIATKVGADMGQGRTDLSKAYILKAVDDSLRRLQTDYIDLYQTHWDDDETQVEETLETYGELVKAGKVKWIGASNLSPERLSASLEASKTHGFPSYQTFQPEYNLYAREGFEKEIEALCLENNLGVINYYALASGFLTGKYRREADLGKSARGGGIKDYLNERGFKILKSLDEVSGRYNTTPASISIAWLIARKSVTAPIASATSLEQLKALTKAAELQLDTDAVEQLNNASAY